MSVDLRKVKKLIELVEESGIAELEVRDGDETIRIARHSTAVPAAVVSAPAAMQAPATAVSPASTSASSPEPRNAPATGAFELRSPMAGTFYRAPSPDAEPFVAVGQTVAAGDVLCIVESMKMMNEIKAERGGVCVGIAVENGEPVGSGQVLLRFE
ncbi:MAG: acetyl-CoA carboxylase biotin carboxyl carrier protein [Pseudomonadota bacterium]